MDFLTEYLAFLRRHARVVGALVVLALILAVVLVAMLASNSHQPFVYTPF